MGDVVGVDRHEDSRRQAGAAAEQPSRDGERQRRRQGADDRLHEDRREIHASEQAQQAGEQERIEGRTKHPEIPEERTVEVIAPALDQVLRVRDELGIGPEPEGDGPPERGERARLEDRPEPEAERECQRRDAENRQASVAPALRRGARKDPAEHIFRSITKRSALSCYGRTPAKSRGTGRISWSASRGDARSASSARPEQTRRSRRRSGGGGAEDYAARLAAERRTGSMAGPPGHAHDGRPGARSAGMKNRRTRPYLSVRLSRSLHSSGGWNRYSGRRSRSCVYAGRPGPRAIGSPVVVQ